ncbi:hypothetical protein TV39_07815 [Arthrobacter sp. SPG23]|uniref:hypothetical protein n=1 Tax=Arthrobacter sp. SPG23 TaxID=1610703 RepID=UPI0005BE3098|nr:hypothetical protein [Arthrobacter sp. SPG23]KIS27663.1 hypothetical protein TV39_07815 [Arthrobacter sp. SPG23]
MDRIEQLMKNAKPQIPGPRQHAVPANPDAISAEPAAQAAPTFSGTFTDSSKITALNGARQSKRRTAIRAGVAGLAAAAVVTLAVVAGNMGGLSSPAPGPAASNTAPETGPSPSASASQSGTTGTTPASASASAVPSTAASSGPASVPVAAWQTFTSANGSVSFDYPAGWNVVPLPGEGVGNIVKLQVTDSAGKHVADLTYGDIGGGLGGACSSEPRPYTVLDTVEMQLPYDSAASDVTPRFTFRALENGSGVNASFGITTRKAGADGQSCMFYNVVNGPQDSPVYMFADSLQVNSAPSPDGATGVKTFSTIAEARAYMQSSGYLDAKRMITSLKITAG